MRNVERGRNRRERDGGLIQGSGSSSSAAGCCQLSKREGQERTTTISYPERDVGFRFAVTSRDGGEGSD